MHPFSIENITSPPRTMAPADYDDVHVYSKDADRDSMPGSGPKSLTGSTHESLRDNSTSPDSGIASPPVGDAELRSSDASSRHDSARDSQVTAPSNEKPPHSYIALISLAILGAPECRLVLSDIYQYVMTHFPYYDNEDRAWRNSIRHNLSLNECFVKVGRAENGKGNYWAVHPACVADFSKGDYRRRQARRRARANGSDVGLNVSALPLAYRSNMGYVPMTPHPAGIGYHPYASPYLVAAAQMHDFTVAGSQMSATVAGIHNSSNMSPPPPYPDQFKTMLQSPQSANVATSVMLPSSPVSPAGMSMPNAFLQTSAPLMTSYPTISTSPTTPKYFTSPLNTSVRYSPYSMSNGWVL